MHACMYAHRTGQQMMIIMVLGWGEKQRKIDESDFGSWLEQERTKNETNHNTSSDDDIKGSSIMSLPLPWSIQDGQPHLS